MTNLLKEAFSKISELSNEEQNKLADALLMTLKEIKGIENLDDEAEWEKLVSSAGGQKVLEKLANEAKQDDAFDCDPGNFPT